MNQKFSEKEITPETVQKNNNKVVSFEYNDVNNLDKDAVVKALISQKNMPVIGTLEIPSINMSLPIIKGISNEGLAFGGVTMSEEQKMGKGNYALAGHHMKNPNLLFSPLYNLNKDQPIYLLDGRQAYVYKMIDSKIVDPTDLSVLNEVKNKSVITLITCNVEGDMRYVTTGELIDVISIEEYKELN